MSKKIVIEFNIESGFDEKSAMRALKADTAYNAISDIFKEVFRPARKHGYNDCRINSILDNSHDADELISLLEERFFKVLMDNNIDLDDCD